MWGISVSEYNIRHKKYKKNCSQDVIYTPEEKNMIKNLSYDERYSNPVSLKGKKCRIDYMFGVKQ